MGVLRDYQGDLLRRVRKELVERRRVVMQLATGGGKTVVAGKLAQGLARTSDRTVIALYLIHRAELADQAFATLSDFGLGEMIGRIQPGQPESRWKPFQIGSIPTVARRLESLLTWLDPLIVVIDETHHCRAETWARVIESFPDAYRLGMTATPARLDGKGLGEHFATIVFGPSIEWLTEHGWFAPLWLFAPPEGVDLKKIRRNRDDYSMSSADEAVDGPVIAKEVDNYVRLAGGGTAIHYAVTIRHSMEFCERARDVGLAFEHIDGKTDSRRRRASLRRLANGSIHGVSNVDVLTEGFDCPSVQCVILGRPTMSAVLYRQMIGRTSRPNPDGAPKVVIDAAGNIERHGPPDDFIAWSLEDGARTEREAGRRSPYRRCGACDMLYPASKPACPACGAAALTKTAAEVDVDLVRWGSAPKKSKRAGGRELAKLVIATGGDLARLDAIRREYGLDRARMENWRILYQPIWAARR